MYGFPIFWKGNNFCDFLISQMGTENLSGMDLLLMDSICSSMS